MSVHATTSAGKLPAEMQLGAVELTVRDIDRAVAFYQDVIGLRLRHRNEDRATMGSRGRDLVVLAEERTANLVGRHAGLYHYALLFESREELANAALRVAHTRTPIDGASDHHTHDGIYVSDPDGNSIELSWDRPINEWPGERPADRFADGPAPLNLQDLLVLVPDQTPRRYAGDGIKVGHVHLHICDLDESIAFYVDTIGFNLQMKLDWAAFVSAGDYHHHLAFDLGRGPNTDPAPDPASVAGLRHWTIELDEDSDLDAVRGRLKSASYEFEDSGDSLLARDPSGIQLLIRI